MDPIHPIVPQPPTIPPVTPAPRAGRVSRDERRRRDPDEDSGEHPDRHADGEPGDERPHIDVIA